MIEKNCKKQLTILQRYDKMYHGNVSSLFTGNWKRFQTKKQVKNIFIFKEATMDNKQKYQSPTALIVLLGMDVITASGVEEDYDKGVGDFF